jgi:NADH-quinone oxidoreductase subunit E
MSSSFKFTEENKSLVSKIISKYPEGRQKSAIMPLLDLAQRQNNNHITHSAIQEIASILDVPTVKVYEVATFYSMYNLKPVGKYFIQVCTTTPCMLRDSEEIVNTIKSLLKIDIGQTTEDGLFTLVEVECLGACSNAPMVQINDWYYEDLDRESISSIIKDLINGKIPQKGSVKGRKSAEPL